MKRKVVKSVGRMPKSEQQRLALLVDDLTEKGPVQPGGPNYSKLSKLEYHCHLSRK